MEIPFYKCNGNGNDFIIVVNNDEFKTSIFTTSFIKKICKINKNKVVDGFILLNNKKNKVYIDYFNNDGSWETLCLNGLRCSSLLLSRKKNVYKIKIECNKKIYSTKVLENNYVKVLLSKPIYKIKNINIDNFYGSYIDSGAKHFVSQYNWDSSFHSKVESISREIRFNKSIFPNGVNVNFYKILDSSTIKVITYEKGIESMMSSCASGSLACAYDYSMKNNVFGKIKIINDGGELEINFDENYMNNTLTGKAVIEYKGLIEKNI